MKKILILGATSAIAESCAKIWARNGASLFLVGRNEEKLNKINSDLKLNGSKEIFSYLMNLNTIEEHKKMLDVAQNKLGDLNIILIAYGNLPNQENCEEDVSTTLDEIKTNAISTIALLTEISKRLSKKKSGTIAVITSVAGDRGRASNYVYGSAKAMVSTFLSGLRQRLDKSNISVVDIKPGFIDTPMTKNYKKNFLWSSPEKISPKIVKAIDNGESEIYVPSFWKIIMLVIKYIPGFIYKKIRL